MAMELIDNVNQPAGRQPKSGRIRPDMKLKIAASCFSIYAFEALKTELEKVESFEFILTTPTFVPDEVTDAGRKVRREFFIPKAERERGFYGSEFEIQLKNKLTQRAIAKECADWMRRKATFRSNRGQAPMQQFICLQGGNSPELPSTSRLHGFTAVDLGYQPGNAVSNFVNRIDEPSFTATYLSLFDQVWNDPEKIEDVTQSLCEHIATVYQENSPERIYFMMLFNIFSEFLENISDDVLPNDLTGYQDSLIWKKLYNFQRDAATGIINKLETYNGFRILARRALAWERHSRRLLSSSITSFVTAPYLCFARKSWPTTGSTTTATSPPIFLHATASITTCSATPTCSAPGVNPVSGTPAQPHQLGQLRSGCHRRIAQLPQQRGVQGARNALPAALLNAVIRQGVKTKVLMLSATPVNNRFADLRNQLALAYEGESSTLREKTWYCRRQGHRERFSAAPQAVFNAWSKLPPEQRTAETILDSLDFDFFEVLDSVTIARSRKHIETFYDTADIGSFPERRKPISVHCQLTHRTDVIGFNEIFTQLSMLQLAVYAPLSYILPSRVAKYAAMYDTETTGNRGVLRQADREKSLQGLMTINLLKRLESSVESFRITLQKLQDNHTRTLKQIEQFKKDGIDPGFSDVTAAFENAEPDDDDLPDPEDNSIGGKVQVRLSDMDLPSWEHDLQEDLKVIAGLLAEMHKITPEHDAKLQHLKTQVNSKISSPINPGNKKILLFTAFADTAEYLYKHLAPQLLKDHKIHTGIVTGGSSPRTTLKKGYDFQSLLTLFSPRSKEKGSGIMPNEPGEIDLLIGTDCISEGQNLQDCDCVINYDIHWNPVRIIQRFGRIDRIGSQNKSIQLVNYWPDITLDEYIRLKERVENRMVIADVTATGDDNPLTAEANDVSYRKEQLRKLQEEVIDMEDLKTGVSITDLGLNDFRMDLLNYVKTNTDLASLPSGMHAVVPSDPARGLHPGVIFTLRNLQITRSTSTNKKPLTPVLPAVHGEGRQGHCQSHGGEAAFGPCPCCLPYEISRGPIPAAYGPFNQTTDDGRNMSMYSGLLAQAIRSIVDIKEDKRDIDSLFTGKTTHFASPTQ